MLHRIFHTKERIILATVLGLILIAIVIFVYADYRGNKRFVEQAVMAENYLRAGSYEEAVEAYLKAMSMKESDKERMSIGLADAYMGLNEYDKALEILRTYYQKASNTGMKEKIEEVSSKKTDYEYLQSLSRAEVYFKNMDYSKAISEYENAKLIKSKEAASYIRIAEAYIEQGKYDLAREEALEGQVLTGDEALNDTLAQIDSYLLKEQYDEMLTQASEYIYQENYKDGIAKYEEATTLLPYEIDAYVGLSQAYQMEEEYDKLVQVLKTATELFDNEELEALLTQAYELLELAKERETVLSKLMDAMRRKNPEVITSILHLSYFKDNIPEDKPVYYGIDDVEDNDNFGLIVYYGNRAYYGEMSGGQRHGKGFSFMLTENNGEAGYFLYDGDWDNDMPSGEGLMEEERVLLDQEGGKYTSKIITKGTFHLGLENGIMMKVFYKDNIERGRIQYQVSNGVPKPTDIKNAQPSPTPGIKSILIGELLLDGKPTGECYLVEPDVILGVNPFITSK